MMCCIKIILYCVRLIMCRAYSLFFYFKEKTAYEMRMSDGISDVCSSDLAATAQRRGHRHTDSGDPHRAGNRVRAVPVDRDRDRCNLAAADFHVHIGARRPDRAAADCGAGRDLLRHADRKSVV